MDKYINRNAMANIMISDLAKEIKKKIEGGKIYGIPVDMENIDHVIVAVYLMCEIESLNLFGTERIEINTLFSK